MRLRVKTRQASKLPVLPHNNFAGGACKISEGLNQLGFSDFRLVRIGLAKLPIHPISFCDLPGYLRVI